MLCMFEQVGCQLRSHQSDASGIGLIECTPNGQRLRDASRMADLAFVFDRQDGGH